MPADPMILGLPAVRALAEREAMDCHNRFAMLTWGISDGWDELDDDAQITLIQVHVDRLADLSRPASLDALARLVAERTGADHPSDIVAVIEDIPSPSHWPYALRVAVDATSEPDLRASVIFYHFLRES